jgi:5-methylcytosine-specific restriction endonuclease McrA
MSDDPFYLSAEWQQLRLMAIRQSGWRCAVCNQGVRGRRAGQSAPYVDHIVPRRKGGSDQPHNLQVLCAACHTRKTKWKDTATGAGVRADGLPDDGSWD